MRRRTATACAALLLLAAGCTGPFDADTLPAVEPGSPSPSGRTVAVDRTVWWGGSSYRLTRLTATARPDGRSQVELALGVAVESPVPVAAALPKVALEADGVAVSGTLEVRPPPLGRASLTVVVQDVGVPGEPLDPDRLALVLTAPGAARAVLPIGDRSGQDAADLRPTPLRPSADTVRTGRLVLTALSARLRADCTGSPDPAPPVDLGRGPLVPRALRALKPGQHTVEVTFDAPAGTPADRLALRLTLPDGRRIAPTVPLSVLARPDRPDTVDLAAWFDFYGDTAGPYALEMAEAPDAPVVLTLE